MKQPTGTTNLRIEVFLSPGFLIALGVLLLNDFYLKTAFHNEITGKLSDFAGLFAVSLAILAFFPRRFVIANVALAIAFVFWKTPLADGLIRAWNSFGGFIIGRTVDYTDYIAIAVLPFTARYFRSTTSNSGLACSRLKMAAGCSVVLIAVVAFAATTLVRDRNLTLANGYAIREKQPEIESALRKNSLVSNIKVNDHGDSPAYGSNIKEQIRVVFFDFTIAEQTCDSNPTAMQMMIRQYDKVTNIEVVSMSFTCREYESNKNTDELDRQYLKQGRELFERAVLKDFHVMGAK